MGRTVGAFVICIGIILALMWLKASDYTVNQFGPGFQKLIYSFSEFMVSTEKRDADVFIAFLWVVAFVVGFILIRNALTWVTGGGKKHD